MNKYLLVNFHRLPLKYPNTKREELRLELDDSIIIYIAGLMVKPERACVRVEDLANCVSQLELVSENRVQQELRYLIQIHVIREAKPTRLLSFTDLFKLMNRLPNSIYSSRLLGQYQREFHEIKLNMAIEERIKIRRKQVMNEQTPRHELTQSIFWELIMLRGRVILKNHVKNVL